jgi:hypothetical protein
MISGDVLKYLNGFFILGRYEAALADSRQFPLTMPCRPLGRRPPTNQNYYTHSGRRMPGYTQIAALACSLVSIRYY